MISAFIVAYLLTGCLRVADGMRRYDIVHQMYKEMPFLAFVVTYSFTVLVWLPMMAYIALTRKPKKGN